MTIIYQGIRRKTTDVLDDYGQAHYLQNVRLKRVGELARRPGLGKSTMAQQAGPVQFMIGAWSNAPFVVNGTGGNVFGQEDPLPLWTAATMRLPTGVTGQPQAPVINFFTITPPVPVWVPVTGPGQISILADITYDGLSGALSYSWNNSYTGPGVALPVVTNANPGIYDMDSNCSPGIYSYNGVGGLTVTTQFNGFNVTEQPQQLTVI